MSAVLIAIFLSLLALTAEAAPASSGAEWPQVTPESVGLDPLALDAIDADFRNGVVPLLDSLLVLRCGSLAYERHYTHDYLSLIHI